MRIIARSVILASMFSMGIPRVVSFQKIWCWLSERMLVVGLLYAFMML